MPDTKLKASQVSEQGYCVIESVYDDGECKQIRMIFEKLCRKKDGFSPEQPTISFHPLLEWGPEMAPFYAKSFLVDVIAEILDDNVRLAHSGAAIFNNAWVSPWLTHWHNHYAWPIPKTGLQRKNPERILCNIYIDGTAPKVGPLIVLPRHLNESVSPQGAPADTWQDQVVVTVPPGSAVLFDTALWHCSQAGESKRLRHLWGGHYQGWHNSTLHPEDNTVDNQIVRAYSDRLPILKRLLNGPS